MSFLNGWSYRKSVTLSRASGAVTNYQMLLLVGESSGAAGENVDCGGLCKTDFSDLRFTTSDGETLLDYYIEDITGTTPNQLASIWIKCDSIGTGATTFYMYYGNAGATAVSNGPNTFILFEDFNALNDGDLNGQNGWSGHANWDVQTTIKYEGAKAAKSALGGATVNVSKALSTGSAGYNIFVQAMIRENTVTNQYAVQFYLKEGSTQITGMGISQSKARALVATTWQDLGLSVVGNTWYKYILRMESASAHTTWVDGTQYSPANQSNISNASATIDSLMLEQYAAGSHQSYFDKIFVGHYLPTGPAWGSWGTQESQAQTTESGTGVDVLSVSQFLNAALADSGSGTDVLSSIQSALGVADLGSAADVLSYQEFIDIIPKALSDGGSGADVLAAINAALTLQEAGSGVDLVALAAAIPIGESGSGVDVLALVVPLGISETGTGSDSVLLYAPLGLIDAGSGADLLSILGQIVLADQVSGMDTMVRFIEAPEIPVDLADAGIGTDALSVEARIALSDLGAAIDAMLLAGSVVIVDAGGAIDRMMLPRLASARHTYDAMARRREYDAKERKREYDATARKREFDDQ